jgi:NodT family efflux transporter outer membrane factor (OMF) lipoprotein
LSGERTGSRLSPLRISVLFLLAGTLCTACALAPEPVPLEWDPKPVPELPGDFTHGPDAGAYEPLEWWRDFADPVLDEVVEAVLTSNFDLAEVVARLQQARVRGRLIEAAIRPTVRARAGVDSIDVPVNAGIGAQLEELGLEEALGDAAGGFTLPQRLGLRTYTLSADFAYELDFRDRIRRASLAAGAELLASESDVHAARIATLVETITAYFDIVDNRRQIAIARRVVDVLEERERLAELRYGRGLADSLALHRARQDLRNAQAGLPALDDRLSEAETRLAILLGGYREDLAALLPDSLAPGLTAEPVPVGVPAELLLQRPDVRAAGHRLEAAGHTIEARRAELIPSLSLSGSIGLQATDVTGIFNVQQWFGNLLSSLLAPVFDGGRLAANVALAHTRFNELAAAYGRTVVTAVNEVEAALAGLRNEGRRHALVAARRDEAQATLDLRSQLYTSGVGDYADFLDASRALLDVESALAGSQRDLALARLAVHRALGGAWTASDPDAGGPLNAALLPD